MGCCHSIQTSQTQNEGNDHEKVYIDQSEFDIEGLERRNHNGNYRSAA